MDSISLEAEAECPVDWSSATEDIEVDQILRFNNWSCFFFELKIEYDGFQDMTIDHIR